MTRSDAEQGRLAALLRRLRLAVADKKPVTLTQWEAADLLRLVEPPPAIVEVSALELRKQADAAWSRGDKVLAAHFHRRAAQIEPPPPRTPK